MISSSQALLFTQQDYMTPGSVIARTVAVDHTPLLGQRVAEVFGNTEDLARFLAVANGLTAESYAEFLRQAHDIYVNQGSDPVRSLIAKDEDLKAFAFIAARRVKAPLPQAVQRIEQSYAQQSRRLKDLQRELEKLRSLMKESTAAHNRLLARHNRLVETYNTLRAKATRNAEALNALSAPALVTTINGGIGLEPERFTVRTGRSQAVDRLQRLSRTVGTGWTRVPSGEVWVRSRTSGRSQRPAPPKLRQVWVPDKAAEPAAPNIVSYTSSDQRKYWLNRNPINRQWRDQRSLGKGIIESRFFDASNKVLHVAVHRQEKVDHYFCAEKKEAGRIVVRPSERADLLRPTVPPRWAVSRQRR